MASSTSGEFLYVLGKFSAVVRLIDVVSCGSSAPSSG
jgi:hypothetical protein